MTTEQRLPVDESGNPQSTTQLTIPSARALAPRFHKSFAGCSRAHGEYGAVTPDSTRGDGKLKGQAVTKREPVTDALWEKHLSGTSYGIGIIPIRDDNSVIFGAVDIDSYLDFNLAKVAAEVARLNLPLIVCRSKSGGAHVYCFTSAPGPAALMQSKLREVAALLGYGSAEVFPKRAQILSEQSDIGSWLNAPYQNVANTNRYAVLSNGDALDAEAFLAFAELSKVGPEFFSKSLDTAPPEFKDGPPCLATLVQIGFPEGSRNDGAYDLAVFVKRRFPDEWEKRLHEFNERFMKPPLSSGEIQGVIGSFKKGKEYRYKCAESPISQHCNPGLCRTRRYGVGGGLMPEFGPLAKAEGDIVLWFWTVNSKRILLHTEELFRFNKFRERCAEVLTMVVPAMKQADWDGVISRAMESAEIIPCPVDATKCGELWELAEKYFHGLRTFSMDEVLNGSNKPYDAADGFTYCRLSGLTQYLKRQQFRDMERGEVSRVLVQNGREHHFTNPRVEPGEKRKGCNYWSVPTSAEPAPRDLPASLTESRPSF
jgi:hypothetical protein